MKSWTIHRFLLLLAVSAPVAAAKETPGDEARDLLPFIAQHCTTCHGEKKKEADLDLRGLQADFSTAASATRWQSILERVRRGEMPPQDSPQPSAAQTARLVAVLTRELRAADAVLRKAAAEAHQLPIHGNLVDHAALFQPTGASTVDAPPRMWRASPHIYAKFIADVGGGSLAATKGNRFGQAFSLIPQPGFKDYSALYTIDEPAAGQVIRNAQEMAIKLMNNGLPRQPQTKQLFRALLDDAAPPTEAQFAAVVEATLKSAILRAPTPAERHEFTALFAKNFAAGGAEWGVRTTLAAMLIHPETVYRLELGAGPPNARGLVRLAPREIAFALSYALTDGRPDAALLAAAENGKLATADEVAAHARRLLDDAAIAKPPLPRFFREYFGYDTAPDVFKDRKTFKDHRPLTLVADTDRLVEYIVARDQQVLRELLTTNKSFVAYSIDAKTKKVVPVSANGQFPMRSYNLEPDQWSAKQPMELPAAQRAGILTQPSWLIAHSLNADNHPIARGKWIRERLLGGSVPDVPIGVEAKVPDEPTQTLRQRLTVTQAAACWHCHQRMNPLGLPLEQYDHFGRFRTTEPVVDAEATAKSVDKKGNIVGPILREASLDTTGKIDRSSDAALDGEVTGAVEMIHKLAASRHVQQVFVRHAFRFWMGRNETPGDAAALIAMDEAYTASDGSFKALLVALFRSESFLYRAVPTDQTTTLPLPQ